MSVLCITMTTDVLISFHVCGISQTASTSIMIVAAATAGRMSKGLLSVTQIHEESAKATCGIRIIPRLIANTSFTVLFILIIAYHRANKPMSMYMHAIREMNIQISSRISYALRLLPFRKPFICPGISKMHMIITPVATTPFITLGIINVQYTIFSIILSTLDYYKY